MTPRTKSRRIGPKMESVVHYVRENPGCTKIAAGNYAWASQKWASMAYIYGPVNRAIKAGLIDAEYHKGRYSLTVAPDAGEVQS